MQLLFKKRANNQKNSLLELSDDELDLIHGGELKDSVKLGLISSSFLVVTAVCLGVGITKMCHTVERNGNDFLWPDSPAMYISTALTGIGAVALLPMCGCLGATIQAIKMER